VVSGDARVYGDARIYDIILGYPMQWLNLTGFKFNITITLSYIRVGCKHIDIRDLVKITYESIKSEISCEREFILLKSQILCALDLLKLYKESQE